MFNFLESFNGINLKPLYPRVSKIQRYFKVSARLGKLRTQCYVFSSPPAKVHVTFCAAIIFSYSNVNDSIHRIRPYMNHNHHRNNNC